MLNLGSEKGFCVQAWFSIAALYKKFAGYLLKVYVRVYNRNELFRLENEEENKVRGQAGDLKNIAARKQLKANAIKKLIFCGLFLALILGFASAALAQEFTAANFDQLKAILTADYSSPTELTVQISDDIVLKRAIKVNRNVTKLTIYLNGFVIDGNDSYPFLQFDGTCDLTLTNRNIEHPDDSHYLDSSGDLAIELSETGRIQNCKGDDGAVIYFEYDNAKITLQNIVFRDNVTEFGGSVVYAGGLNCELTAK